MTNNGPDFNFFVLDLRISVLGLDDITLETSMKAEVMLERFFFISIRFKR